MEAELLLTQLYEQVDMPTRAEIRSLLPKIRTSMEYLRFIRPIEPAGVMPELLDAWKKLNNP